jgi:hypothetical protein
MAGIRKRRSPNALRQERRFESYGLDPGLGVKGLPAPSRSVNFDHRRRPDTLRTAMATAFFWPDEDDQLLAPRSTSAPFDN